MFRLDEQKLREEFVAEDDSSIEPFDPMKVDADELHGVVDACLEREVITSPNPRAWLAVYPLSISEPEPLLSVNPGPDPLLLGGSVALDAGERKGDEVEQSVIVLRALIDDANALLADRNADSVRLDRIAAYMEGSGSWTGAELGELLANELRESGRPLSHGDGSRSSPGSEDLEVERIGAARILRTEYGEEATLGLLGNGRTLRTNAGAVGQETFRADYVRVVSADGRELAYWDHTEWRDDPQEVMGAIFGAFSALEELSFDP